MPKFYLTTAIDYSNGDPHLGHALEKIGADCIARYHRLRGDDVHFLMGMDEHSQSVIQAAAGGGVTPQAWVDRMAATFADHWRRLECSPDDWIVAEYEGLYCTGCEEFKTPAQIANGHCIEHPTLTLVPVKEENHFFRLSAYRDAVLERIRSGALRVEPEIRRNEVLRLLEAGLQDVSISRQRLPWGIPFPGDPEQTVYVWFDALINYLSATGFPEPGYERLWPADLHVVGKGITRFHCVIWPAMLLAAGLELPRLVWAHGYVQWEGTKMSKTAGTAVSLGSAIQRHGADALRYFLLREVGFENDGNFTWDRFDARYTADLADTFGNLVSRTLSMVQSYRGGIVPDRGGGPTDTPLERAAQETIAAYTRAMDKLDLLAGAVLVMELASRANRYVQETAPWKIAKEKRDAELDAILISLVRTVARLAVLAAPFIPAKAEEIWAGLGTKRAFRDVRLDDLVHLSVADQRVSKPQPLFPKPVVV